MQLGPTAVGPVCNVRSAEPYGRLAQCNPYTNGPSLKLTREGTSCPSLCSSLSLSVIVLSLSHGGVMQSCGGGPHDPGFVVTIHLV